MISMNLFDYKYIDVSKIFSRLFLSNIYLSSKTIKIIPKDWGVVQKIGGIGGMAVKIT